MTMFFGDFYNFHKNYTHYVNFLFTNLFLLKIVHNFMEIFIKRTRLLNFS